MTEPTNIQCVKTDDGALLTWDEGISPYVYYDIYSSVDGGAYAKLTTIIAGIEQYLDTREGFTFKYKIKGINPIHNSNYTEEVSNDTPKRSGVIVRYAAVEDLAELVAEYGETISMHVGSPEGQEEATLTLWKEIQALGIDLGVWTNAESNSCFVVNSITPDNQVYYQALDDALGEDEKGIQEFFTYGGKNYCLLKCVYPTPLEIIDLITAGSAFELDFSTISGGSNITIVNPVEPGVSEIYLDSTKAYAGDFPVDALDKWWAIRNVAGNTWRLEMNAAIPLEDYCGEAISNSDDYTGDDQVILIMTFCLYPKLQGLRYCYLENIRAFDAYDLIRPYTMAETESGGYPCYDDYGETLLYDLLTELSYKGATKCPAAFNINLPINRFRINASSNGRISTLCATVQDVKEHIADKYARNDFPYERATTLTGILTIDNWETIIQWLQENNIRLLSYKKFGEDYFDKTMLKTTNIFPRLNVDLAERDDGTPDGFDAFEIGVTLRTSGGAVTTHHVEFTNATADVVKVTNLHMINGNEHTFRFYAKNDGTGEDTISIVITGTAGLTENINAAEWTLIEKTFTTVSHPITIIINISSWNSSGTVNISDIEMIEN